MHTHYRQREERVWYPSSVCMETDEQRDSMPRVGVHRARGGESRADIAVHAEEEA